MGLRDGASLGCRLRLDMVDSATLETDSAIPNEDPPSVKLKLMLMSTERAIELSGVFEGFSLDVSGVSVDVGRARDSNEGDSEIGRE